MRWWQRSHRTELEKALAYAPPETARFSWTDWAGVRRELGAHLDDRSSAGQLEKFLSDGFDADLTSSSAMVDSATVLQQAFGFSPADVDWELLAQSATGSVLIAGLPDSLDLGELGDGFESLGYERPERQPRRLGRRRGAGRADLAEQRRQPVSRSSSTSPWTPTGTCCSPATAARTCVRRLAMWTTTSATTGSAPSPARWASRSPRRSTPATSRASRWRWRRPTTTTRAPLTSWWPRPDDVDPMTGFAMAVEPDRQVRVAMAFESDEQARRNADSRARLAAGPAPGQGGDFGDRFTLGPVTADGSVVTMELKPVEDSPVLSDLSTGPVLFATC